MTVGPHTVLYRCPRACGSPNVSPVRGAGASSALRALRSRALPTASVGQDENPRFGKWLLDSNRPPPAKNVMTYEPYGEGGMRITVASTNAEGVSSEWGLRYHVRRGIPSR